MQWNEMKDLFNLIIILIMWIKCLKCIHFLYMLDTLHLTIYFKHRLHRTRRRRYGETSFWLYLRIVIMYRAIVSQRVCRRLTFVVAIAATRAKYAKMKMFFNSLSFWYFNNKHHLFYLSLSSSFFFLFLLAYSVSFFFFLYCIHLKCSLKFLDSNKLVISC